MKKTFIEFYGIELEIDFIYHRGDGGTDYAPPSLPEIEILKISVGGIDITPIAEIYIEQIEDLVYENY